MTDTYAGSEYKKTMLKLRELLAELPPFCAEFFRGIEHETLVRSRYAYAIDFRTFFTFLIQEPEFSTDSIRSLTLPDLDRVTVSTVESYLSYISFYNDDANNEVLNGERAKKRKLSSLRALYKYFCKKEKLKTNAPSLVDLPVVRDKAIVRLEPDEVANLLDIVQEGEGLSETQKRYHKRTQVRDLAILTLFLGTGIRISELVGINMDDVNFSANEFTILRKGGKQDILVFGEEARAALLAYMLEREGISPQPGHEEALFLSLQNKRITVRAVENLVQKYARLATPLKKISPHKLRSTYGTMLYRETGDIYLVADVLGHKDVNTTRKHYAAVSEDRRRIAAKVIKLRED
ncbi:MAG: tyrosine-type recombinase/integrase [Christensenellaceae bacterium]|jgi:site-specific recombinase XerD|nr:tyrosine-type recombinase/integrase [Christensenellaceae bacterium]